MLESQETVVEILKSNPTEQCVIRMEFLDDLEIDPDELAAQANRKMRFTYEIREVPDSNMALRDRVCVYSPEEEA
ncbi:MAG: hypothetical protein CML55_00965 [Rhodobacteraceae bacterium]|nr:hypothetical protein [Paracoccaceae bacterium]